MSISLVKQRRVNYPEHSDRNDRLPIPWRNHYYEQASGQKRTLNHASQAPDFGFQFLDFSLQVELVVAHERWMTIKI